MGETSLEEVTRLREENQRLVEALQDERGKVRIFLSERDEARAEAKKYHDALIARHGGEPVALLAELDEARNALARKEAECVALLEWKKAIELSLAQEDK